MITQKEYESLLKSSPVFNSLSAHMQLSIVKAKSEDRERYERIFLVERDGIEKAKQDLLERNNIVVKEFEYSVRRIRRDKTTYEEIKLRTTENADQQLEKEISQA